MSPLAVYHIPCNHTSDQLSTGFGTCPQHVTISLPVFRRKTVKYVPWMPTDTNNNTINLHYESLKIPPPLKFNQTVLNALDQTFHRIDGDLADKLKIIRKDIKSLHEVNVSPLALILASIAFAVSSIHTIIFIALCCYHHRRRQHQPNLNLVHYVQTKPQAKPKTETLRPLPEIPEEEIPMNEICPDCGDHDHDSTLMKHDSHTQTL